MHQQARATSNCCPTLNTMHLNNINLTSWNAFGISTPSKMAEIVSYANKHSPDIIFIQESYLNTHHTCYLPNYACVRGDRLGHGGGLVTFVRHGLKFRVMEALDLRNIEHLGITINIDHRHIHLSNVYIPRDAPTIKSDLKKLMNLDNHFMAGDFNAKHPEWSIGQNAVGDKLFDLLPHNGNRLFATLEPSYHCHNGSRGMIDLAISNVDFDILQPNLAMDLISDHTAVKFELVISPNYNLKQRFDYEKANWQIYKDKLREQHAERTYDTFDQIDAACDSFAQSVIEARDAAIPLTTVRDSPITLAKQTTRLITRKNVIQRQIQRSYCPTMKAQLRAEINCVKQLIKERVRLDRNNNWGKLIEAADKSPKKFWATSKLLRNKKVGIPALVIDQRSVTSSIGKANAIADFFHSAHTTHTAPPNEFDTETNQAFNYLMDQPVDGPVSSFDYSDIMVIIGESKNRKAPGKDEINNVLLKKLPVESVKFITGIFNRCVQLGHWPKPFKTAIIVPIIKKSKPTDRVESYRPISMLSAVAKIFERAVLRIIHAHCDENNVIPDHQFGFRRAHSAAHQATKLASIIRQNKCARRSTGVIALDISKAFDSVWHAGLILKFKRLGFAPHIQRLIASFCSSRSFEVKVGTALSAITSIPAGVPQGSALSPLLYNIYTADVPRPKEAHILTYADDTAFVASGKQHRVITRRLKEAMSHIDKYLCTWHISTNVAKTQYLFIPPDRKRRRLPSTPLMIDGLQLTPARTIEYLGVVFDNKANYRPHIQRSRGRALGMIKALYPMIAGNQLSESNRMKLIKQIVWPTVTYAAAAWADASETDLIRLRRSFSRTAKKILKLPWRHPSNDLYHRLKLPFLEDFVSNAKQEMAHRCRLAGEPNLAVLADFIQPVYNQHLPVNFNF